MRKVLIVFALIIMTGRAFGQQSEPPTLKKTVSPDGLNGYSLLWIHGEKLIEEEAIRYAKMHLSRLLGEQEWCLNGYSMQVRYWGGATNITGECN